MRLHFISYVLTYIQFCISETRFFQYINIIEQKNKSCINDTLLNYSYQIAKPKNKNKIKHIRLPTPH